MLGECIRNGAPRFAVKQVQPGSWEGEGKLSGGIDIGAEGCCDTNRRSGEIGSQYRMRAEIFEMPQPALDRATRFDGDILGANAELEIASVVVFRNRLPVRQTQRRTV